MSPTGISCLEDAGVSVPKRTAVSEATAEDFPSGSELLEHYFTPLAEWLKASGCCEIRTGSEVVSIGKGSLFKVER